MVVNIASAICTAVLFCAEGGPQFGFLVFGQIRRQNLKGLAFQRLDDLVHHRAARQQKEGRRAFGHLLTRLLDEVVVDAVIVELSA